MPQYSVTLKQEPRFHSGVFCIKKRLMLFAASAVRRFCILLSSVIPRDKLYDAIYFTACANYSTARYILHRDKYFGAIPVYFCL